MIMGKVSTAFGFPSPRELLRAVGRGQGWGAEGNASECFQAGPHPNPPHGSASLRRGREREAAASIKEGTAAALP